MWTVIVDGLGEKLFAYQLLQALHLLTDGGLGTTYRGSGRREGAQIGDGDEGPQQIEIEIQYRTICIYHISSLTGANAGLPC